MMAVPTFDPDFASPADYARLYRQHGLQVIPAKYPMLVPADKRPAMAWAEFHDELVNDAVFERWFPVTAKPNMGVITGHASGNLVVVDLDVYKSGASLLWWDDATGGIEPETWKQTTGGGGKQILLRVPDGVMIHNASTDIGVDLRGQGGFAMLPPSRHLSGKEYAWDLGCAPWEAEIAQASSDLLEAIQKLSQAHPQTIDRTATPPSAYDAWGNLIDGREKALAAWVWRSVLKLRRSHPAGEVAEDIAKEAFERSLMAWLERTRTRVPGVDNIDGLEREGRGPTAFLDKWRRAMKRWEGRVAEQAARGVPPEKADQSPSCFTEQVKAARPEGIFEYLDVEEIKAMPDPEWLVSGLVVERSMGFVFGPPGSGKSFIALGLGLSLAVGMPDWWGRSIGRPGAVIYISSEGQADLKFRIQAWEHHHQVLADKAPFYLIRQTINFLQADDVAKLMATVEAIQGVAGTPPVAVFVDTVSRVLPGADENLQKDMTLFVSACDAVRQRFDATVIGVHHTSRNGNLRGSTVFDGAGDFLAQIDREEGAKVGTLTARKIKAAEDGWEQKFLMRPIELPFGKASIVAVEANDEIGSIRSEIPDKRTCRAILSAMDEAWASGRPWSNQVNVRRLLYAPKVMVRQFGLSDIKVAEELLDQWLYGDAKLVSVEVRDAKSHVHGLRVTGRID